MWGGNAGPPVYEKLIEPGSSNGLFVGEGPGPPGARRHDVPSVVAWCLTIAAVLSTAAVACQMAGFSGLEITTRLLQFSFVALYPAALLAAAAVALSLSEGRSREGERPRRATRWAEVALAVCGVAVLAAAAYTVAALFFGRRVGAEEFEQAGWASRIAYAGWSIACGILAGIALYVIGRGRRGTTAVVTADENRAADTGDGLIAPPSRRLLDPVVACVLVAAAVLVVLVVTSAFPKSTFPQGNGLSSGSGPGPSIGSRISSVSSNFSSLPIAFAALAVVVLVAARRRRQSQDGFSEATASVAAMIGLLAVLTAGYGVWRAATDSSIAGSFEWWWRASAIGTALASGTLGAAAGYVKSQLRSAAPAEPEPVRTRFDPRVVALCLANAALGTAALIAITVARDEPRVPVGELLLQSNSFILLSVGLAFAAAIVLAFSVESTDATQHRTLRNAVDAIAAIVSLGTLVTTVFVIVYVVGHNDSKTVPTVEQSFSALDQSSTTAKVGYVTLALASGLLATGVLRLVWSSRHPSAADDESGEPDAPGHEIPVVDLLP